MHVSRLLHNPIPKFTDLKETAATPQEPPKPGHAPTQFYSRVGNVNATNNYLIPQNSQQTKIREPLELVPRTKELTDGSESSLLMSRVFGSKFSPRGIRDIDPRSSSLQNSTESAPSKVSLLLSLATPLPLPNRDEFPKFANVRPFTAFDGFQTDHSQRSSATGLVIMDERSLRGTQSPLRKPSMIMCCSAVPNNS